jgi:3-oxoacyl-[acyl-carrier protein] reductase
MSHTATYKRCSGRVAIVTGGARGIGRAIALALAAEGARVAVWDVNAEPAEQVAAKIRSGSGEAMAGAVDVSNAGAVRAAVDAVRSAWGRIDILVNNAGIAQVKPIEQISEADWDRIMAVNLKGTFLCSQAVMGVMKRQRSGKIINLGFVAGKIGGITVGSHYSASKAAVMCFTKFLARELASYGVNVNALAPGVIETDMTHEISGGDWSTYLAGIPMGRLGTIDEVARVAVFLASDDASYLTGEIIDVNGGQFMD